MIKKYVVKQVEKLRPLADEFDLKVKRGTSSKGADLKGIILIKDIPNFAKADDVIYVPLVQLELTISLTEEYKEYEILDYINENIDLSVVSFTLDFDNKWMVITCQ